MDYRYKLKLDIYPSGALPLVRVKQGDNSSRFLDITLTKDGNTYTPEAGVSFIFRCEKPDGHAVLYDSTMPDGELGRYLVIKSGSTISVELTSQATVVVGSCHCDLCLMKNGAVLSTIPFVLEVLRSPNVSNLVNSSDEFRTLISGLTELTTITSAASEAIENANAATTNANTAASNANSKASLANTAATNANNKANLANTAATNANNKAALADAAATSANTAAGAANTAADDAQISIGHMGDMIDEAKGVVVEISSSLEKIDNMTATATSIGPSAQPTVTLTEVYVEPDPNDPEDYGHNAYQLNFGIPSGNAVSSVNGNTGTVVLSASDVGAVSSVNGNTGVVVLTAADVGAVSSVNGSTGAVTVTAGGLGAVKKAGDTMTGSLVMSPSSTALSTIGMYQKNFTVGTVPTGTSDAYGNMRLKYYDAANNDLGQVYVTYTTNDEVGLLIEGHRTANSTECYNSIRLLLDNAGNAVVKLSGANVAKAWRNALGLGTNGTLPLTAAQGGTGLTTSPSLLVNLGSTSAANVLQASPRPGITGTLPVSHGGIGVTSAAINTVFAGPGSGSAAAPSFRALVAADIPNLNTSKLTAGTLGVTRGGTGVTANPSMLVNLASTAAASVFAAEPRPGITGVLKIANGGTGQNALEYITNKDTLFSTIPDTITITSAIFARFGMVAQLYLAWSYSGTISPGATANISDIQIGTLNENYRPKMSTAGHSNGNSQAWYSIATGGAVKLTAVEGTGASRTIAEGTNWYLMATYILQKVR